MDEILDVRVIWQGVPVLLTKQLAEFYGCPTDSIKHNFGANKAHFTEGKHYFILVGEALRQFKSEGGFVPLVGKTASSLYLWTRRGAARHAKMLQTDKAWDVFETLEDNYFNREEKLLQPAPSIPIERKLSVLMELIKATPDELQKIELIQQAAFVLNQN